MTCNICISAARALQFGEKAGFPPILNETGEKDILSRYTSLIGKKAIKIQNYSLPSDLRIFSFGLQDFIDSRGSSQVELGFTVLCYYFDIRSVDDLERFFSDGDVDVGQLQMIPKVGYKVISLILMKIYLDRNKNRRSDAIKELKEVDIKYPIVTTGSKLSIPIERQDTVISLLKLLRKP